MQDVSDRRPVMHMDPNYIPIGVNPDRWTAAAGAPVRESTIYRRAQGSRCFRIAGDNPDQGRVESTPEGTRIKNSRFREEMIIATFGAKSPKLCRKNAIRNAPRAAA
jgi:hypothetical protein